MLLVSIVVVLCMGSPFAPSALVFIKLE
jgi:hypothetical protein